MPDITPTTCEIRGQRRALCCQCVHLRYVSRRAKLIGFMPELPPGSPVIHCGRFTAPRHCEVCNAETRHALLRDGAWLVGQLVVPGVTSCLRNH
jgi:hypothetical protein